MGCVRRVEGSLRPPHTGVRFFSVDPGEMDTRMHADALGPPTPGLARPEEVAEKIVALLDTARSGERVRA